MNFHDLMAKMRELDQPTQTTTPAVTEEPLSDCGDMPGAMNTPMDAPKDHPPPSLSVNMNAQGLDDIAELMQLLTKVNPDMASKADAMPTIDIKPMSPAMPPLSGLGNLDSGPLKMLPDLDMDEPKGAHAEPDADNMGGPSDNDADNMPGGMDGVSKAQGDLDNDGDHDMDDHDMEKKDKKDEWANEPDEETKDVDYMVNKLAGGMNKPKQMVKHSYRQGDNPMAFRESIKQDLQRRLEEAKAKGAR